MLRFLCASGAAAAFPSLCHSILAGFHCQAADRTGKRNAADCEVWVAVAELPRPDPMTGTHQKRIALLVLVHPTSLPSEQSRAVDHKSGPQRLGREAQNAGRTLQFEQSTSACQSNKRSFVSRSLNFCVASTIKNYPFDRAGFDRFFREHF